MLEVGDLAFFDDEEGIIKHVGIILENDHIIHSYGKVRVDRLDQTCGYQCAYYPELKTTCYPKAAKV